MAGNNAPAAVLELNDEQAKFLLKNCDSNIAIGLELVMSCTSRVQAEPLILLNEQFKQIRDMLRKQGIENDQ